MTEETDAALRRELEEAIGKVRNQMNAQNASSFAFGGGLSGDQQAVAALQQELGELESALANLPADG